MDRMRRGFTIVEILVVIAIISILLLMLLPVYARSKAEARKTYCKNNLKQLATAIQIYENRFQRDPPWITVLDDAGIELTGTDREIFLCPVDGTNGTYGGKPPWDPNHTWTGPNKEDAEIIANPSDPDGSSIWDPNGGTDSQPCSYYYEDNVFKCEWANDAWKDKMDADPKDSVISWREAKYVERNGWEEQGWPPYGDGTVPMLRCFWHTQSTPSGLDPNDMNVINLFFDGHVNTGRPDWKLDIGK